MHTGCPRILKLVFVSKKFDERDKLWCFFNSNTYTGCTQDAGKFFILKVFTKTRIKSILKYDICRMIFHLMQHRIASFAIHS